MTSDSTYIKRLVDRLNTDDGSDPTPILPEIMKYHIRRDVLNATKRFFPLYQVGDAMDYCLELIQPNYPISWINIGRRVREEGTVAIVLYHETSDDNNLSGSIGLVTNVRGFHRYTACVTFPVTGMVSEKEIKQENVVNILPSQSPADNILPGDTVTITNANILYHVVPDDDHLDDLEMLAETGSRLPKRKPMAPVQVYGMKTGQEYIVLGTEHRFLYVAREGMSHIEKIPRGNVIKKTKHDIDARPDQEIRDLVTRTIHDYFRRKKIYYKYGIIRQLMREEALLGQPDLVRRTFEKEELGQYDEIIKGFNVIENVKRALSSQNS